MGLPLHHQPFLDVLDRHQGATRREEEAQRQRERRRGEADGVEGGDAIDAEWPEDEALPIAIAKLSDPLHQRKALRRHFVLDGTDIVVWVNDETVLRISVGTWVLVGIEANWLATETQVKQDDAHPRHMYCMGVLKRCLATAAQAYLDRRDRPDAIDWSLADETEDKGRRRQSKLRRRWTSGTDC
jgi:hypothetical protein